MAEATQLPTSWSDIPLDLAGRVLRLLPACVDRARFAAVCPQWRDAARQLLLPAPLPLLALPDGTFHSIPYGGKPFRFPGSGCAGYKAATTCGSWLVFPRHDGCFLVDPFAGATVELPSLSRIRLRPANAVRRKGHPYTTWMSLTDDTSLTPTLNKLVLCSPKLAAATFGDGPICQILMCQPGASSWSVRAYDSCRPYEDLTFYQGKLYGLVSHDESLLVVNISQDPITGDPQVARIGQAINGDPDPSFEAWFPDNTMHMKKLYLVESCTGALLMIRRKVCCRVVSNVCTVTGRTIEFQVLEADWEHSRWVKVATLGDDQMLFLGRSCSKVVRASQYGMSGDQIFFLDDVYENDENYNCIVKGNTSASVYDLRTGEISSPLPMVWKRRMLLATWLFPK